MRLVDTSAFRDSGSGLVCQMPAGLDNPYYAKTGRAMRYVGREVGATHDFSQTNSFFSWHIGATNEIDSCINLD